MNLFNINRIFCHIDVQITNIELIRGKKRVLYGMEVINKNYSSICITDIDRKEDRVYLLNFYGNAFTN